MDKLEVSDGSTAKLRVTPASAEVDLLALNSAGTGYVPMELNASEIRFDTSATERLSIASDGVLTSSVTGGILGTNSDGGGFYYKQLLDYITAGCTFTGKSNRGDLASISLYQTATGADGGYIKLQTSPIGSTTPTEKVRIASDGGLTVIPATGGHAVFNTDGVDADFRVESNGNANMLFVDGGNDRVGIGTASPNTLLHLSTTGGTQLRLTAAADNYAYIEFGDTGDEDIGTILYSNIDNSMRFIANANEGLRIDSSGNVTKPLQPAFNVYPASIQTDIATNTAVTVVFGTEAFDQGSNFASNTFTAPVTGEYQLQVFLNLDNYDADAGFYQLQIQTSNKLYTGTWSGVAFAADASNWVLGYSVLADMDASDTAYIAIYQYNGTAQTDIAVASNFSGYLVA